MENNKNIGVDNNTLENNKDDNSFIFMILFFVALFVGITFLFPTQPMNTGNEITFNQILTFGLLLLPVFIFLILLGLLKELVIFKNKGIKRFRDFFLELLILILSIIVGVLFFILLSKIFPTLDTGVDTGIGMFVFMLIIIPISISYIIIYGIGITFSKNLLWLRILTFITSFYLMLNIFNNM